MRDRYPTALALCAGAADVVQAMRPVLASCMQSGQSLRLSTPQLRLVVAEPLYHALAR